jgi:hypothetical protein
LENQTKSSDVSGIIGATVARSRFVERHRFAPLLASLLILILASPVFEMKGIGQLPHVLLTSLVLMAAVIVNAQRRVALVVALGLSAAWVILSAWNLVAFAAARMIAANLLFITLLGSTLVVVFRRVLAAERVDADVVCGGVAVYLMIGLIWAASYVVMEAGAPGSFTSLGTGTTKVWNQLLYFSLTTLTTLGYGDVHPSTPVAGVWSTLEAVTGVLYLAVFMARLVSLYRR